MKTYSLHVLRMGPTSRSFTIALADAPTQTNFGNPLPTVVHASWEQLSASLTGVGIGFDALDEMKARIRSQGFATLKDISLSEDQKEILGFHRHTLPRSAA